MILIENTSKTKVLGATNVDDDKFIVTQEDFEKDKAGQLWKKGMPDADGYFTLENVLAKNKSDWGVLTAISESDLEFKGNITLR